MLLVGASVAAAPAARGFPNLWVAPSLSPRPPPPPPLLLVSLGLFLARLAGSLDSVSLFCLGSLGSSSCRAALAHSHRGGASPSLSLLRLALGSVFASALRFLDVRSFAHWRGFCFEVRKAFVSVIEKDRCRVQFF